MVDSAVVDSTEAVEAADTGELRFAYVAMLKPHPLGGEWGFFPFTSQSSRALYQR